MSLPRYERYKDSGVEWIGEIPEGWNCKSLKYMLRPGNDGIKIGPFGSALKSEYLTSDGYKVYGQENVINDDFERGFRHIDENKFQELEVYEILTGDLLITMMGTTGLAKLVPSKIKKGIMDSHLIRVRPDDNQVHPIFLQVLINDSAYIFHQKKLLSNGSIMEGLNSSIIKSFSIVLPPPPEQTAIATFLDRKTAEIDQLIANKEKLIALYEEEKTTIINRAVTRGLDPAAKTQPSGVDWLGDIPEHWEVKRLKYFVSKVGSGVTPKGGASVYQLDGIPLLRSQNIHFIGLKLDDVAYISQETHDDMSNSKVMVGDVLLNITGASIGRCYFADEVLGEANVNQHVCIIRPTTTIETKFLYYLLRSDVGQKQIDIEQTGSGREGLNFESLKNFNLCFPPPSEQTAIVTHIETECARLDAIIAKFKKQIELFKEYRTTLISEVVTGKIDLRGEVA